MVPAVRQPSSTVLVTGRHLLLRPPVHPPRRRNEVVQQPPVLSGAPPRADVASLVGSVALSSPAHWGKQWNILSRRAVWCVVQLGCCKAAGQCPPALVGLISVPGLWNKSASL